MRPLSNRQFEQKSEAVRKRITAGRSAFVGDTAKSKAARIARAVTDQAYFRATYLSDYFVTEPAAFHLELDALAGAEMLAVAAPREHAKSTVESFGRPLHKICFSLEHFILIGSDTETQAIGFTSAIKDELEVNERLRSDFPDVTGPCEGSDADFVTKNDIKILARGAGQKVRGLRYKQWRPTYMVWDDLENDELVESPDRRRKLRRWWFKALLNSLGKGGKVRIIGTILHPESLLAELLDQEQHPLWTKRTYRAPNPEDPDAVSLWPAMWPMERLATKKATIGSVFYAQEFRNEPIDEETALFREEWFQYFDDRDLAGLTLIHYGTCDPSLGKNDRSDDSAIIDGLVLSTGGLIYIDEADVRRRKPQEICEDAIEHGRRHPYVSFGFESVGFQLVLKQDLERLSDERGTYLPVVEVDHEGVPKDLRIRRLSPLIERGVLRFRRSQKVLLDQLRNYRPNGRQKDDGPDALEMLVRLIRDEIGGGPRIRSLAPAFSGGVPVGGG